MAAVRVSMLATIMVSVRAPVRSGTASLPSSRTFMRAGSTGPIGTVAVGPGVGRCEHPVEQGALGVGQVRGGAERDGHAGAERDGDRGPEHLVAGAAGARVCRDEGPHDDRDPGDHDEDAENRDREQDTRRHEGAQQAGAAEVGGGGGQRRRATRKIPITQAPVRRRPSRTCPRPGTAAAAATAPRERPIPIRRGRRADPDQERRPTRATRPMLGGPTAIFDSNERGWPLPHTSVTRDITDREPFRPTTAGNPGRGP